MPRFFRLPQERCNREKQYTEEKTTGKPTFPMSQERRREQHCEDLQKERYKEEIQQIDTPGGYLNRTEYWRNHHRWEEGD